VQEYILRLEAADPAAPLTPEIIQRELRLPEGWRIAEAGPAPASAAAAGKALLVGEVFTYVLLLWPAVIGLLALQSQGWQLWLRIALGVWLGLMHLVAYRRGRGAFFGNSLLMLSGCVAGFWWTHPGPWMYLWLVTILIGLYATVRGVLNGRAPLREAA